MKVASTVRRGGKGTPRASFGITCPTLPKQVQLAIDFMTRKRVDCLLCGASASYGAFWFPTPELARVLGQPDGKIRAFGYSLCEKCKDLPDSCDRVETVILDQLTASV